MDINLSPSTRRVACVSAIIPARNEEASIGAVVRALLQLLRPDGSPWVHEVIVANNGSTDGTAIAARAAGATVIYVAAPGYGQACWEATRVACGDALLFVDGDGAADASDCPALLSALEAGCDLAIGTRLQPDPGSMTASQVFGNALACALIRWVWGAKTTDLGPHRAVSRAAFDRIAMQDRGFGWTVEMQVRAHLLKMAVVEVPVAWRARTGGVSKISGTLRGVVGAGCGILGMVFRLWRNEQTRVHAHAEQVVLPGS
jgi:glycosyltransferase involved in cell wall biosynthesis